MNYYEKELLQFKYISFKVEMNELLINLREKKDIDLIQLSNLQFEFIRLDNYLNLLFNR